MPKLRVASYTISVDGFGAGPNQTRENPLGENGEELHDWLVTSRMFNKMYGKEGGTTGVDNQFAERGFENLGAWIMGRNMFGPVRGPWPDYEWKGWWGPKPPYKCDVFVLTHHSRPPLKMENDTTFYFVTEGIHRALELARQSAAGKDIRIGGGAETIRQYLREGLIDEMHFAISPIVLGSGEPLFHGADLRALGYKCSQFVATDKATHVVLERRVD